MKVSDPLKSKLSKDEEIQNLFQPIFSEIHSNLSKYGRIRAEENEELRNDYYKVIRKVLPNIQFDALTLFYQKNES